MSPYPRPDAAFRNPDPLLCLAGVSKTFANGTCALRDMTLTVRDGEFLSLLGPSGCGKSTVLKLIAGLSPASAGALEWARPQAAADISFVFQEPTLMPWATVFKNVALPLRLKGAAKAKARAQTMEALETVGLSAFANAYPRELSGGMKMRVSIARALVTRPKVLLMDEPFAALDEITRLKLNDELLALWRRFGWTVVFVTHSIYESVYLSGRIAVMSGRPGRVSAEIAVEAPYPRDAAFRVSPAYGEHVRAALRALDDAAGAPS